MCTVVILRRPGNRWPVIIGANRDEMLDRSWKAPARHWPDRPEIVAGLDELAGGSWLGINDTGVVATVLNRFGTLGPDPGKRSRGELVLEALDHADAEEAAEALADLQGESYRPFNMLIADNRTTWWIANREDRGIAVEEVPDGISMLTAHDLNDEGGSDRIARYLDRFRKLPPPDPDADDWDGWTLLMGSRDHAEEAGPSGAMNVETFTGFGTGSAAQLALPAVGEGRPLFRFAAGRPDKAPFEPIEL